MDLSKLINRFLEPVTWIFQSCSVYFSPFDKQNQADAWPRFHGLLKLLHWNNGESKYWMNAFGFVVPLAMFALKDAHCTLCNIKKRFKALRDIFCLWNTDITKTLLIDEINNQNKTLQRSQNKQWSWRAPPMAGLFSLCENKMI